MENRGEILIYQTEDKQTEIEVRMDTDTVWLSLNQISELFDRNKSVVSRHIYNIFKEGELPIDSTVAKYATVQTEGNRIITREIEYFNLDVVISVGYRVKSKRGTQFRIWANKIIKEYLTTGYILNNRLLKIKSEKLNEINNLVKLISGIAQSNSIKSDEKSSFLLLLEKYSEALNILDDYDYQRITEFKSEPKEAYHLTYEEVIKIIVEMKETMGNSDYFGKEKDESLNSSISAIYQTYDNIDLYPTIEEKASNLLYFLVKNHSFVDGNKRIAAAIFIYFLEKNNILSKIELKNELLVALTLTIANSNPKEKNLLANIVAILIK
jgi:prophage maintenance system killer protein